jgi:spermidine synthase
MYHAVGTGLTLILLYLISYIFYRIGYYSLQFHIKLWNYLLAAAFLITAVAGLFMALQITYKWNVPFVRAILKYHVEFGIGMAITGVLHFIRHLSYFKRKTGKADQIGENRHYTKIVLADISTNLFIVGLISSSIQLLLIREMMNIAGGYELITGTFLGSWLIGSALGSSIAGQSALTDVKKINIVFSLSPVISLFLLLFLSRLFLNPGETPSFLVSIIYTFLVLVPFCIVSGFTFIKLIYVAGREKKFIPGKSFSIETAGGIVAGIIISLLTAGVLNTYQLLLVIIILANAYVLLTYFITSNKVRLSANIVISILITLIILFNPDNCFRQALLPGIKITGSEDTPYGNITKGTYKGEESIYYNHRLLSYKNDVAEREENIHYAMLQCNNPEKVIIISGSLSSHLPELLKYPVKKIIFIERDPALAKSEDYTHDSLPADVIIANTDAFRYIRNHTAGVDAILLLVPSPSTLLLNRYYTTEFFAETKKRLNPGGVFMCSPGPYDGYLNKESLNLYSSIFNSLSGIFKNVIPIAGNKLYFIASDKYLSSSICNLVSLRKISNIYVSPDFLADDLIKKKSDEVIVLMDRSIRQNTSSFPVACFHFQSYNFSKDLNGKIPSIVLLCILFAVPITAIKRSNMIMYFSASALAGFEIIILLMLQLIIGNMYQLTGLIIAGLMSGLAIGAGVRFNLLNSLSFRLKSIILFFFYISFGLIFNQLLELRSGLLSVIILAVSAFLPALLTGHFFRELTLNSDCHSASPATYSADLAGSAFGFIFLAGFAVPAYGIKVSIFILSLLIFAGFLFGTIRNK